MKLVHLLVFSPLGLTLAILAILTKSAILAIFCQFRQICSSIGIDITSVSIGDCGSFCEFDKIGNYSDISKVEAFVSVSRPKHYCKILAFILQFEESSHLLITPKRSFQ